MIGNAYIEHKQVYLSFDKSTIVSDVGYCYNLGINLVGILSYDIKDLQSLYNSLVKYLFDVSIDKNTVIEDLDDTIINIVRQLDDYCIYLHFYTIILLNFFVNYSKDEYLAFKELFKIAKDLEVSPDFLTGENLKYFNDIKKELNCDRANFSNPFAKSGQLNGLENACYLAVIIVSIDILYKRTKIKNEIEILMSMQDNKSYKDSKLKLFLMDIKRAEMGKDAYYTYKPFTASWQINLTEPHKFQSFEEAEKYILINNRSVIEVYELNCLDDLIRLEFVNIIKENMFIRQCKYCKQYFFPIGRADTEYCGRIIKGESKRCSEIGPIKLHQKQRANDPIYQAFKKAYCRMNSRARQRKITQTEFLSWSEEARRKRDACSDGLLSFDDFQNWLDENRERGRN